MSERRTLTHQELEIMKIVWELGPATVRDVYEVLLKRRKIAYTTVLTMMKILEQKKYVKRAAGAPGARAHVYQPARPKERVIKGMVREFVDRVFNGSAEPLLVHLVRDRRISDKDLERIARLVRGNAEDAGGV